jgi:DNA-binding GntR family transcriptional regulator
MHSRVPPIDLNGTLQERVKKRLRDPILTGQFQPGTGLVQADIASSLKVSLTPVREAMRDLHAEREARLEPRCEEFAKTSDDLRLRQVTHPVAFLDPRSDPLGHLASVRTFDAKPIGFDSWR